MRIVEQAPQVAYARFIGEVPDTIQVKDALDRWRVFMMRDTNAAPYIRTVRLKDGREQSFLHQPSEEVMCLCGIARSSGRVRATSELVKIDLIHGFALTNSGSVYELGMEDTSRPPHELVQAMARHFMGW
jgi:hypothetical protein